MFFGVKKAFTLAETLIALAIIGVIAVLVIPRVVNYINEMSWSKAKDNFEQKIEEAAKQMNVTGVLSKYSTNEAFTDVLQNYIKVAKRCSVSNLDKCFVSTFTTSGRTEISTNSLLTGANLGHSTYTSPLVGLSLINGTNVILAFNPNCTPVDWYDTSGSSYSSSSQSKSFVPGNATSCFAMLYDINGNKPPNTVGKDIGELNAFLNGDECFSIGGICIATQDEPQVIINTCADTTWDSHSTANSYCTSNRWAGAKKSCSEKGKRLPTDSELTMMWNAYNASSDIRSILKFTNWYYFSSTECNPGSILIRSRNSDSLCGNKSGMYDVRCVK